MNNLVLEDEAAVLPGWGKPVGLAAPASKACEAEFKLTALTRKPSLETWINGAM